MPDDNLTPSTAISILARVLAAATFLSLAAPATVWGQTAEHVAEAKAALEKAPIRAGSCAPATEALQGWPADVLQRCEYKRGNLAGVAYVLDVRPEAMAKWIETSCKTLMVGIDSCYQRMTKCLGEKSGAIFIVGGNGVSERQGAVQNVFYRNGVAFSAKPGAVSIEEQEQLARTPEADVTTMLGGGGVKPSPASGVAVVGAVAGAQRDWMGGHPAGEKAVFRFVQGGEHFRADHFQPALTAIRGVHLRRHAKFLRLDGELIG